MAFRFRQSIKLLPGLRLNIGKTGVSTSIGGPGASINLGRNGPRATVGIPGTGLSYSTQINSGSAARTSITDQQPKAVSAMKRTWMWIGLAVILIGTSMFNGGNKTTSEGAALSLLGLVVVMAGSFIVIAWWLRRRGEEKLHKAAIQARQDEIAKEEMARATELKDQATVLLYLARSDGRMTRQERDAIVDHILAPYPDGDAERMDKLIREAEDPGTPAYRSAVERLTKSTDEIKSRLVGSAQKMVGTGRNADAVRDEVKKLAETLGVTCM